MKPTPQFLSILMGYLAHTKPLDREMPSQKDINVFAEQAFTIVGMVGEIDKLTIDSSTEFGMVTPTEEDLGSHYDHYAYFTIRRPGNPVDLNTQVYVFWFSYQTGKDRHVKVSWNMNETVLRWGETNKKA